MMCVSQGASNTICAPLSHIVVSHPSNAATVNTLDSTSILQQSLQIPLLALQLRISPDMFLRNEDVRHSRLARQVAERRLNRGTVIDLIQLNRIKLRPVLAEQLLRRLAVGTVALGEDRDGVLVDNGLHFGFGGRHAGG